MNEASIVKVVGRMPYASNATLLVHLADGDRGIYKPTQGEEPLWDFPHGTLAARETLAWETSNTLGLDAVPHTYLTDGPFGIGSVQRFVTEDSAIDPRPLLDGPSEDLWDIAVLDLLINNADRKLGHILIETDTGRLWAIDNGLSFHPSPKLRTLLWGFADRPIPDQQLNAIQAMIDTADAPLIPRVEELLGQSEATAFADRCRQVLATGIHPPPPHDRPAVPWPMW